MVLLLPLVVLPAACNDGAVTRPQTDAAFTLTASGSTSIDLTGTTLTLPTQSGAFRSTVNGRAYVLDVTPIVLVQSMSSLASSPQLTLNLLGRIETGTYRVHRDGAVPSDAQLQARLIVPAADGLQDHYLLDAGTITVTSLNPLVASFSFSGTQRLRRPREEVIGQSVTSQPGPITVTGRIGVR